MGDPNELQLWPKMQAANGMLGLILMVVAWLVQASIVMLFEKWDYVCLCLCFSVS